MFGYIAPYRADLKVRDDELFKAYYCGVCRAIDKENGLLPRFALNYDIVFLGLFLSSIVNDDISIENKRCIAHPVNKRKYIFNDRTLEYTANIGTILAYFNLLDNWTDDRSKKSLIAAKLLKNGSQKARKKYNHKYEKIKEFLAKLSEYEENKEKIMDKSADAFGKIMEEICDYDEIKDDKKRKALKWFGYNTGRWIYILDAFDDIEDDYVNNSYNPLIEGMMEKYEDVNTFKNRIKERIEFTLISSLSEMAKSYELLDIENNKDIIDNIVYIGMRNKMDSILNKTENEKRELNEKSLSSIGS